MMHIIHSQYYEPIAVRGAKALWAASAWVSRHFISFVSLYYWMHNQNRKEFQLNADATFSFCLTEVDVIGMKRIRVHNTPRHWSIIRKNTDSKIKSKQTYFKRAAFRANVS